MSYSLNPDQARHFVEPDLGPKCLQSYQQMTLSDKELIVCLFGDTIPKKASPLTFTSTVLLMYWSC